MADRKFRERIDRAYLDYMNSVDDCDRLTFEAGAKAALDIEAEWINETGRIRQTRELANEAERTACKIADEIRSHARELVDG